MAVLRSLLAALVVGVCAAGAPDPTATTTVTETKTVTTVTAKITFQGPSGQAAKFQAASPQVEKIVAEAMGKPATCTRLCVQQSLLIPSQSCTSACKPATTAPATATATATAATTARAATTLANSLYFSTFTSKDAVSDAGDRLKNREADMLSIFGAGWFVQSISTSRVTTTTGGTSFKKTTTRVISGGTTTATMTGGRPAITTTPTTTTTGANVTATEGVTEAAGGAPSLSVLALVGCLVAAVLVA